MFETVSSESRRTDQNSHLISLREKGWWLRVLTYSSVPKTVLRGDQRNGSQRHRTQCEATEDQLQRSRLPISRQPRSKRQSLRGNRRRFKITKNSLGRESLPTL